MTTRPSTPTPEGLPGVISGLAAWQRDDAPIQLHPGDLGWHGRAGVGATAAALRTWHRDGELVAVGFLDGATVLRLTVAPEVWDDDAVAQVVVEDLSAPERGVLPAGAVDVEAPDGTRVREVLDELGWTLGQPWAPLALDLDEAPDVSGLDVEVVEQDCSDFTAVHRSAWDSERFTDDLWRTMTTSPAYEDARCLLLRDDRGRPVAGATVWGAGAGRPGLLEPVGVHADHRRLGHGTAVSRAAAAHLRDMGSTTALVCTEGARDSAVATYVAAGFARLPERLDRSRPVGD